MKSYWEALQGELKKSRCQWCMKESDELYDLNNGEWSDTFVCIECLRSTEYEEPERGLNLWERNK